MVSPQARFQSIRLPLRKDGLSIAFPLEDQGRYLVNPGSIGQPRDGDWRAAFAIFDSGQRLVEYFRTAYDLPRTQAKMRKAGLPQLLIQRLEHGR
jgi:diadenosine tetraphosphatase ApaH/serine/threonine PP2A family protein phosphatase